MFTKKKQFLFGLLFMKMSKTLTNYTVINIAFLVLQPVECYCQRLKWSLLNHEIVRRSWALFIVINNKKNCYFYILIAFLCLTWHVLVCDIYGMASSLFNRFKGEEEKYKYFHCHYNIAYIFIIHIKYLQ